MTKTVLYSILGAAGALVLALAYFFGFRSKSNRNKIVSISGDVFTKTKEYCKSVVGGTPANVDKSDAIPA